MIKSFTNCAHALSQPYAIRIITLDSETCKIFRWGYEWNVFLAMRKIIGNKCDFIFNLKHEQKQKTLTWMLSNLRYNRRNL